MSLEQTERAAARTRCGRRSLYAFVLILLCIELLDEILFGAREAAWPLIRDDLQLSYTQIGLLLGVPALIGNIIEPASLILADVRAERRRALVLAGGIGFAAATLLIGLSSGFATLMLALVLINPASGLFVGLSQAVLMDAEPERRELNMARWALAGSLGNCVGPLLLTFLIMLSLSWRWLFAFLSLLTIVVLLLAWRSSFPARPPIVAGAEGLPTLRAFAAGISDAFGALRRREVLRWLVLLELGDLTWDVMRGFLALYFVDAVGVTEGGAALAVVLWTWAGLPGDLLMLPLLRRVRGINYLRLSTILVLLLFPAFLLAEAFQLKLLLLGLLGLANAGWYAILKARLYAELPGRSGTALALCNLFGLAAAFIPLTLGAYAETFGVGAMMWLLVIGPFGLLLGLLTAPTERA